LEDDLFLKALHDSGISPDSGDLRHYEEAKKWAGTMARDAAEYGRLVQVAAEYVGV